MREVAFLLERAIRQLCLAEQPEGMPITNWQYWRNHAKWGHLEFEQVELAAGGQQTFQLIAADIRSNLGGLPAFRAALAGLKGQRLADAHLSAEKKETMTTDQLADCIKTEVKDKSKQQQYMYLLQLLSSLTDPQHPLADVPPHLPA